MCGPNINNENELLMSWINATPLQERIHLLGIRHDVHNILPAYDIFMSSSSCGEAFGNVIGEAMACAVPCVVTDVGDSAIIVGDTATAVPPRDPVGLAKEADNLLQLPVEQHEEIGTLARQRVAQKYSLSTIAKAYSDFYLQLGSARVNAPQKQTV